MIPVWTCKSIFTYLCVARNQAEQALVAAHLLEDFQVLTDFALVGGSLNVIAGEKQPKWIT